MDYLEAVRLAQAGNERGFGYLYENTYKSKYYLALRYMKNREAAEDVLQDAYLRAFSKLDTLKEPEHFPAWLGQIVASTAKNALAKNNPVLFTDVTAETEIEDFEEWIEDEDITFQPELSYTREETRTLVRELIDALSEEQRLCILMFHIEGMSIKEIARILECSENTVKSRLNYGRKNMKEKAEELQRKGYKLYNIAPLPLLLYLFRSDFSSMLAEKSIQAGGRGIADRVFAQIPNIRGSADTGQGQNASSYVKAGNGAKTGAVKAGFLHTAAGKAAVAVLGICIVGGAVYGITQALQPKEVQEAVKPVQTEPQEPEEAEDTEDVEEVPQPVSVADGDYQELLEGGLTKEELEFLFAYGPETLTEQGLSEEDYLLILNGLCGGSAAGGFITSVGMDENYRSGWEVDDLNRFMSSFTDYRFTEENDSDTPYGTDVDGSTIWMFPAELSFEANAKITDAAYLEDTMVIHFSYEKNSYENGPTATDKTATLKKNENGRFRIVTIEEGYLPAAWETEAKEDAKAGAADQAGNTGDTDSIRAIYEGVLQSVQNQEAGYGFPNAGGSTDYQYFLCDMDGNGVKELVVGAMFAEDVFEVYDIRVFTITQDSSGDRLKPLSGDIVLMGPYLPSDGKGLYSMEMSRGTGETDIYRITIEGDTLIKGNAPELRYTMGDSAETQFINANAYAKWRNVSDLAGLDE